MAQRTQWVTVVELRPGGDLLLADSLLDPRNPLRNQCENRCGIRMRNRSVRSRNDFGLCEEWDFWSSRNLKFACVLMCLSIMWVGLTLNLKSTEVRFGL